MADPGSGSNGSPPREFWEDDLEMPIGQVLAEAESDEFMQEWLDLLAAMPAALVEARSGLLEAIWVRPMLEAIERRL